MPVVGAFIVPHPPLIIPEIGKGREREIQKTIDAYEKAAGDISALSPDTIVVATPHSVMYSDYLHISPGEGAEGDFSEFGAHRTRISVKYDAAFASKLSALAERQGLRAGTLGQRHSALDHGTMVPLFFVNRHYEDYKLVRLCVSGLSPLSHYRFGQCVAAAAAEVGKRVVVVASGDLSHRLTPDGPYGFAPEGPVFDREVTNAMSRGDFLRFLTFDENLCAAAAECGLRSFLIMAGALDGKSVSPALWSYEGPFGVGYAVASFAVLGDDENRRFGRAFEEAETRRLKTVKASEDEYVSLARSSLERFVKTRRRIEAPAGLPQELTARKAGVFVSLKMEGALRGCIGTIAPAAQSVAEEIIQNAVSAGTEDPRFDPVREDELDRLCYSVDVLELPEPISSMDELDPKRYGVIVSAGYKRGLLLPNLEGIDTPRQQVSIALKKAGIPENDRYSMERFEVVRHV